MEVKRIAGSFVIKEISASSTIKQRTANLATIYQYFSHVHTGAAQESKPHLVLARPIKSRLAGALNWTDFY